MAARPPLALTVLAALFPPVGRADDPPPAVRVTVVVVLASREDTGVDPKLTALAREVRKRDDKLVGFRIAATVCKSIPVGGEAEEFDLVDKQTLSVRVNRPRDADGRIGLTITPPKLGDITYACACSKFFPVVTPYKTDKGEQLILAVMAKPCSAGKKP